MLFGFSSFNTLMFFTFSQYFFSLKINQLVTSVQTFGLFLSILTAFLSPGSLCQKEREKDFCLFTLHVHRFVSPSLSFWYFVVHLCLGAFYVPCFVFLHPPVHLVFLCLRASF